MQTMNPASPKAPRSAQAGDLEALTALERRSFDDPWSTASLRGELESPDALVLLIDGDSGAVAYAAWRIVVYRRPGEPAGRASGEAELLRIAVAPDRRRRGLASTLLAAGEGRLAAAGCEVCHLEVRDDNLAAVAFYEGHGFHPVGRRRSYYGEGRDALLYARRLAAAAGSEGRRGAPSGG